MARLCDYFDYEGGKMIILFWRLHVEGQPCVTLLNDYICSNHRLGLRQSEEVKIYNLKQYEDDEAAKSQCHELYTSKEQSQQYNLLNVRRCYSEKVKSPQIAGTIQPGETKVTFSEPRYKNVGSFACQVTDTNKFPITTIKLKLAEIDDGFDESKVYADLEYKQPHISESCLEDQVGKKEEHISDSCLEDRVGKKNEALTCSCTGVNTTKSQLNSEILEGDNKTNDDFVTQGDKGDSGHKENIINDKNVTKDGKNVETKLNCINKSDLTFKNLCLKEDYAAAVTPTDETQIHENCESFKLKCCLSVENLPGCSESRPEEAAIRVLEQSESCIEVGIKNTDGITSLEASNGFMKSASENIIQVSHQLLQDHSLSEDFLVSNLTQGQSLTEIYEVQNTLQEEMERTTDICSNKASTSISMSSLLSEGSVLTDTDTVNDDKEESEPLHCEEENRDLRESESCHSITSTPDTITEDTTYHLIKLESSISDISTCLNDCGYPLRVPLSKTRFGYVINYKDKEAVVKLKRKNTPTANRKITSAEIKALVKCQGSSSVVKVLTAFADNSMEYVILERIKTSAAEMTHYRRSGFQSNIVKGLIKSMLSALFYIHDNSYLHLGVRPEHIYICRHSQFKLGGFDNTISFSNTSTQLTGSTLDNLKDVFSYYSPDIHKAVPVDKSEDFFSLGVTVYELLTNSLPWSSLTQMEECLEKPMVVPFEAGFECRQFILHLVIRDKTRRLHRCQRNSLQQLKLFSKCNLLRLQVNGTPNFADNT